MNDDNDTVLRYQKMLEYEDIKRYAERNNKVLDRDFFKKYGFFMDEIDWIQERNPGLFKTEGDTMTTKNNDKIKQLQEENKQLKNIMRNFEKCFKYNIYMIYDDDDYVMKKDILKYDVETKEFYKKSDSKRISYDNTRRLYDILEFLSRYNNEISYYDVVKQIILTRKLDVDVNEFNGGKNRALYMFPYYYNPLQVLKFLGIVGDAGKNNIIFHNDVPFKK